MRTRSEYAESTRERYCEADILRSSGELAGRIGRGDAEAFELLERAVRVAKEQQSRSFELRATTALARWLAGHDRHTEAVPALDAVMPGFTEGRDSTDFVEARDLKVQLIS